MNDFPSLYTMKKSATRTLRDFIADLGKDNMSVAQWAAQHGVERHDVYMVLRGATRGRRGKARRIFDLMGVTPPPVLDVRAKAELPA